MYFAIMYLPDELKLKIKLYDPDQYKKFERESIRSGKGYKLLVPNESAALIAIEYGNLECLKWIIDQSKKYLATVDYCSLAARFGQLNCLKWLHENGFQLDVWTLLFASKYNHTDCIIYCIENDCPADEIIVEYAAYNGNLRLLEWALGVGFQVNKWAILWATERGFHECLKYLLNATTSFHPESHFAIRMPEL